MTQVETAKRALRQEMRARLGQISQDTRAACSKAIARRVLESAFYRDAADIFMYASTALEVDTWPMMLRVLASGRRLYLPRTLGRGVMEAVRVTSLDTLVASAYGILEPTGGDVVAHGALDLLLAPGVAFDRTCARLGHGGGYYDRFLEGVHLPVLALAFEVQMVERVPTEAHDARVDAVATEKALYRSVCGEDH